MTKRVNFATIIVVMGIIVMCPSLEINATRIIRSSQAHHIISLVHQKKMRSNFAEIREFDFDDASDLLNKMPQPLEENLNAELGSSMDVSEIKPQSTDDFPVAQQNTLENSQHIIFGTIDQKPAKDPPAKRVKQSIPVLEPVRHLLNTVRDGGFNHTAQAKKNHHQLVSAHEDPMHQPENSSSSAIETEEEREMATESTEFKLLDLLGSIGSQVWGFFGNLQKLFAASSGTASAASSSSSSN